MIGLLLDAAATYRLTRLATADVITQPARERIIDAAYTAAGRREEAIAAWGSANESTQSPEFWHDVVVLDAEPPKLATLITCRWCAGMWVAFAVVVARTVAPRAWAPVRDALAFSTAAALLARLEDD